MRQCHYSALYFPWCKAVRIVVARNDAHFLTIRQKNSDHGPSVIRLLVFRDAPQVL
jgi:hypothetical protein